MIDRRALLKASAVAPWVSGLAPAARSQTRTTGPFEVVVAEGLDLQDRVRNRKVPTRVYYPAATGRYPVIIFSHGFGGSLSAFANTGRIWASHGYVVIHPTHADSVQFPDPSAPAGDIAIIRQNLVLRDAADAATRAGLVRLLEKPFYLASRLQDISFVQEGLRKGLPNLDDEIVKRCDLERQGMAGHSFGAYTTLVVSGSTLVPPSASPVPRGFASGLAISGQGAGRMGLNEASFGGITRPLMAVTGTRDFGAAGETPPWRLEAFDRAPPGRKYAVVVEGFAHMDFDPAATDTNHDKGDALRRLQVAFWDASLKGDSAGWADLDQQAGTSKSTDAIWLRKR